MRTLIGCVAAPPWVLIAHRLSTVRDSDMIFVLEDGRIAEQGTYDYLYAAGGRFAEMVDQQAVSNDGSGVPQDTTGFVESRMGDALG